MARLGKFFYINGTDNLSNAHFLRVRADGGITESLGCIDTAGTLLESASYFMRPSGYKEDTVYSLIPNNSNGSLNFTRASDAWRTEIGGLVQRTPYNLLTFSEQFENSVWTKTRCAVTTNSITSPNGTITADTVVEDTTASASHPVSRAVTFNAGSQTFSVYAKAANRSWIHIALLSTANAFAYFDLSNGTVGTIGSATTASIQSIGDGWYRCIMSATTAAGSNTLGIYPASADANNVYTGNGTDSIYIWGSQLVEGVDPLPYFPTTDRLNVPRLDYTYGTCPALLLEPQRTNLALRSEEFDNASWTKVNTSISANTTATLDPMGGNNADKFIANTTNNIHNISQSSFASAAYSFTVYAKAAEETTFSMWLRGASVGATFNLSNGTVSSITSTSASITSVGNGWYRCFVYDSTAGTTAHIYGRGGTGYAGNGTDGFYIFGAQVEAGAYPTTYIPTTSATATRVADSFSRSNIYTNGLISASGGTWFVELRGNLALKRDDAGQMFIGNATDIFSSTHIFAIGNFNDLTSRLKIFYKNGSGFIDLYTTTTNTVKIAIKWNGATADIFVNGTKVNSAISFSLTNMNNLIANGGLNPTFIQQMALFNYPLSDANCQLLTT